MTTTTPEIAQTAAQAVDRGHLDPALEQRLAALIEARVAAEVEARVAAAVETRVAQEAAALVSRRLEEELQRQRAAAPAAKTTRRLAIVASKGTLDMAYPPLILATTAAAMGWEVAVFFTFYGLDIINRRKLPTLKVAPLGNPAMPVPVPNLVGALPGMTAMATIMMKQWFTRAQIPTLQELLDVARDTGVELISCTTTMGVMGVKESDLIPGVTFAGAGHFLDYAAGADVTLFV